MLIKMSANYVCGFVTFAAGTCPAVFCLISRSVVDLEALCVIATVMSDLFLPLPTMTCRPLTRLRAQSLLIWQVRALGLSHISILRDTRERYIDNPEINWP